MLIRPYQPGDEAAQVQIYNQEAAALPGFKPSNADEVARRYRAVDADLAARLYVVEDGGVVGYAVANPNGRISYPWCLPRARSAQGPLLEAELEALRQQGRLEAWAAYRADWAPVLSFFREHGFEQARSMINYVAGLDDLLRVSLPPGRVIRPLERGELPRLVALGGGLFAGEDHAALEGFFWRNPYFGPSSLFTLRPSSDESNILGVALLIVDASFADPTRIDAAMPCFRLGAMGNEGERHKRVNGLFSCVFAEEADGVALLAEAARRLAGSGVGHIAAQAPSDRPSLVGFYDRHLRRQGSFPILSRHLGPMALNS